jgi:hypothetical protein
MEKCVGSRVERGCREGSVLGFEGSVTAEEVLVGAPA